MILTFKPSDNNLVGFIFSVLFFLGSFFFEEIFFILLSLSLLLVFSTIVFGIEKVLTFEGNDVIERIIVFNKLYKEKKKHFNHNSIIELVENNPVSSEGGGGSLYLLIDDYEIHLYGNKSDVERKFNKTTKYIDSLTGDSTQ